MWKSFAALDAEPMRRFNFPSIDTTVRLSGGLDSTTLCGWRGIARNDIYARWQTYSSSAFRDYRPSCDDPEFRTCLALCQKSLGIHCQIVHRRDRRTPFCRLGKKENMPRRFRKPVPISTRYYPFFKLSLIARQYATSAHRHGGDEVLRLQSPASSEVCFCTMAGGIFGGFHAGTINASQHKRLRWRRDCGSGLIALLARNPSDPRFHAVVDALIQRA